MIFHPDVPLLDILSGGARVRQTVSFHESYVETRREHAALRFCEVGFRHGNPFILDCNFGWLFDTLVVRAVALIVVEAIRHPAVTDRHAMCVRPSKADFFPADNARHSFHLAISKKKSPAR